MYATMSAVRSSSWTAVSGVPDTVVVAYARDSDPLPNSWTPTT